MHRTRSHVRELTSIEHLGNSGRIESIMKVTYIVQSGSGIFSNSVYFVSNASSPSVCESFILLSINLL
jgi:hypothetical protein